MSTERYTGFVDCPCCFESSGYVWEHGNDWDSGPWSHQTNVPCPECNGTGKVECEPRTLDDLESEEWSADTAAWFKSIDSLVNPDLSRIPDIQIKGAA